MFAEQRRLRESADRTANWKRWGPYLSERQWGTVREDYSAGGEAWGDFPHDQARSRAYRWGEDGILGITDRECRLCFALAMWNGRDPILKERLFGLTGPEGNHSEDAKECWYYLDSSPTHSYMKGLYKYPQGEYPYAALLEENRRRDRNDPEFELEDTGVFDAGRYFDVTAEYAKAGPDDILVRIHVTNRGDAAARLHLLPTLWFRNTWVWGCKHEGCTMKPLIERDGALGLKTRHETLEEFRMWFEPVAGQDTPELLVTDNHTNTERLWGVPNPKPYVKDSFHDAVVRGKRDGINKSGRGTKAAAWYRLDVPAGGTVTVRARLASVATAPKEPFGSAFSATFADRLRETDEYYAALTPPGIPAEEVQVRRQAFAGLLWSKQFYHYIVKDWLEGDPETPPPPPQRRHGRNHQWEHLFSRDIISMPDKWEYPWFAAWDLAFHMIPFAEVDPDFAKEQLLLFLREWYMHPNGQIPAYEWAFGDVNPPVHAWAAWRVYKMTGPAGGRDRLFLERVFQKLLMNFTWWVNRKDPHGNNIFAGGFLGLDNIGVFDRSQPLPTGGHLEQADGTAWMAFYCGTMLAMAIELAQENPAYEDIASKFFEHFVAITDAINTVGGSGLWDEGDGFYYDQIRMGARALPLRIRSLVGVMPMIAVEVIEEAKIAKLPGFRKRMEWFLKHRGDVARHISFMVREGGGDSGMPSRMLLAIPSRERLERVLRYLLEEDEFLSPHGIRSLSRVHARDPYILRIDGREYRVDYTPGESNTGLFGGNSNWRGPIWFPLNYLVIEALERYGYFYGDSLRVECPAGSGQMMTLKEVAGELARRLTSIFLPGPGGHRPAHGGAERYATDPAWRDLVLFHEYFHGDTGRGVGANHQTGWTALVARLVGYDTHTVLSKGHNPAKKAVTR